MATPSNSAPGIRWNIIALVGAIVAMLWGIAIFVRPLMGIWPLVVVGVLTLVVLGFGIYLYRWLRRTQKITRLRELAQTPEGRKEVLEQLAGEGKDALSALTRAELTAQDGDMKGAIAILEAVDIAKAGMFVQDQVRASLAKLQLDAGHVKEAAKVAVDIRLDRAADPQAKGFFAGVVAEALARSGKPEEAKKLLETYQASDPTYSQEIAFQLYRAQVYTYHQTKNRGLLRKAMENLAQLKTEFLGYFLQPSVHPELKRMAQEVLSSAGAAPRVRMKVR